MNTSTKNLEQLINEPYKYGFNTNIKVETIEKGLNEKIIHLISSKKEEPPFMLEFRLKAFEKWKKMNVFVLFKCVFYMCNMFWVFVLHAYKLLQELQFYF